VRRLRDLFNRRSVDDRLLSGELSPESGEGRVRAEQLLAAHHREQCAQALRDLVEEAQRSHPSFFSANLRVQRFVIRENQALILTLAQELEELAVVNPRGVILADRLVQDGESPAYAYPNEDHGELARAVQEARAALKAGS
jgi:uncharacterized protein YecE (DUF72 family)